MEWLMVLEHLKMEQWYTQDSGDVIKNMEKERKISSKEDIIIKVSLLMISIVVKEPSKDLILAIQALSKIVFLRVRD